MKIILFLLGLNFYICYHNLVNLKKNKIKYNLVKTCYPDDENDDNNKIIYNFILNDKPFYKLIWYDCENCEELLENMQKLNLKKIYINEELKNYIINPLLYKDDKLIANNLFDIYEKIYEEIY